MSDELFEPFDSATRGRMRRRLKNWYATRARKLPWRQTGDPYCIWISEIMLQQTTVSTVIPFYERFTSRFPNVQSLAAASEEEVLRLWEGLGYYSRARNIHKASKVIVENRNGIFPTTVADLIELPGIGRYTAGAIVSFAFNQPAPIVEANTLRLYSRLISYEEDPRKSQGQRTLWAFAEHLLPRTNPGDFNQSLMDLGSLVCTPKEPNCEECPLNRECRAFLNGRQDNIPMLAKKPKVAELFEASVAIESGGKYLIRRNQEGEWWAGLWDFTRFAIPSHQVADACLLPTGSSLGSRLTEALEKTIRDKHGIEGVAIDRFVKEIKHSVTRYRIHLFCFLASVSSAGFTLTSSGPTSSSSFLSDEMRSQDGSDAKPPETRWVAASELDAVPFSMTGRKLAKLIQQESRQLKLL